MIKYSITNPPPPGTTFRQWTVVGPTERDRHTHAVTWCQCSCKRTTRAVALTTLNDGTARMCKLCSADIGRKCRYVHRIGPTLQTK